MSKNSTGLLTFLVGTALGVTAGFYLNSENGKKMRNKTKKQLSKMEATIEEKVNKAYDDLKSKISDTSSNFRSAKSNVKDAASNLKNAATDVKDAAKA